MCENTPCVIRGYTIRKINDDDDVDDGGYDGAEFKATSDDLTNITEPNVFHAYHTFSVRIKLPVWIWIWRQCNFSNAINNNRFSSIGTVLSILSVLNSSFLFPFLLRRAAYIILSEKCRSVEHWFLLLLYSVASCMKVRLWKYFLLQFLLPIFFSQWFNKIFS